jgi:hypothetical protein
MRATYMKFMSTLCTALVAAAVLAGCGAMPPDQSAAASGTGKTAPGQAAHPYIGKPRPPVSVTLVPGASLESGVPGQLTLQVHSGAPLEAVRLTVRGDEGLTVVGFREAAGSSSASRQDSRSFEVSATPTSGGTRYVSGLLSFTINGVEQAVPFKLPVQVGGPVTVTPVSAKPERLPVRDSTGELIDSMPAETTVR